jgi:hypothetical protein
VVVVDVGPATTVVVVVVDPGRIVVVVDEELELGTEIGDAVVELLTGTAAGVVDEVVDGAMVDVVLSWPAGASEAVCSTRTVSGSDPPRLTSAVSTTTTVRVNATACQGTKIPTNRTPPARRSSRRPGRFVG